MNAEDYYETYWSKNGFSPTVQLHTQLKETIGANVESHDRCLDVGCGDGNTYGVWLKGLGCDYVGVDVSANAIDAAIARGLQAIEIDDASSLPFEDQSFDSAICIDARESGAAFVEVWGTGFASREFLYVDDAAEGIVLGAEGYNGNEPINLGVGQEITIKELVELIVELTGYGGEIRWDPTKPDGQPRRARDAFGFTAGTSFEDGLRTTIEWYEKSLLVMSAT